jgi:hypothetical protein
MGTPIDEPSSYNDLGYPLATSLNHIQLVLPHQTFGGGFSAFPSLISQFHHGEVVVSERIAAFYTYRATPVEIW